MGNKFAEARKVMARELLNKTGKGDDCGYRANITMLIYDDQTKNITHPDTEVPLSLDLTTVGGCQVMADRIIQLIFS